MCHFYDTKKNTPFYVFLLINCFLKKVIETERGQQLADEFSIKFMETSAKNSINVDQAFITLAQDIKKRLIDTDPGSGNQTKDNGVKLGEPGEKGKDQKGDCGC